MRIQDLKNSLATKQKGCISADAGLTPMQAVVLAAKNAAEHLGISGRKGIFAVGKEADFILLGSDPAKNIRNTTDIKTVNGKSYDCIKVSLVLTMFSWAWTGIYHYEKIRVYLFRAARKRAAPLRYQAQ